MKCYSLREGQGRPLLLIHGLGGNSGSWRPIWDSLARHRLLIALDLPGHGRTPPLEDTSIATYADVVQEFISQESLKGVPLVGSSMGARIVLELARRGHAGPVVALDPGGFWGPSDLQYFSLTLGLSIRLIRSLGNWLEPWLRNPLTRSMLLAQLSARPWAVPADTALHELRSYATAPSFDAALRSLVKGPLQEGTAHPHASIVLGWGRKDKVLFPRQARSALAAFPTARIHWFDHSGHFPQWDEPEQTIQLILEATKSVACI